MEQQRLHHNAKADMERRQRVDRGRDQRRHDPYGQPFQRPQRNYFQRPNNSSFARFNRFNIPPVRTFSQQNQQNRTNTRPACQPRQTSPRPPTNTGPNQVSPNRSNRTTNYNLRSRGNSRPNGARANGVYFQDHSQLQPRQDNYYMQHDSFYQGEPDHVPEQNQCDDGFFNQDMHPSEEYPAHEDGFFNQEDSFFGQDNDNYEDDGGEQHDAYEVSA